MRLSPEEHYAKLARKRVSVGVMIFHEGKLLVVEPTYEPHFLMPGGGVDSLETPRDAAIRECKEELGLDIQIVRLLGVDETVYPESYRGDCLHFFFLAKDLTSSQVAAIRLPADELQGFKFVTPDEAFEFLGNRIRLRMRASMDAIASGTSFYSENGKVV
ncbi:MAG: NUDIX hydrolase, partial [Bdellovibrionota bacterium]